MERLTERYKGEAVVFCNQMCSDWNECNPILCQSKRILEKLAHYEDLEEQGLLLKLPCNVGDTVYEVKESITTNGYCIIPRKIRTLTLLMILAGDFGKTVFLTKEEAEAKLKELGDK